MPLVLRVVVWIIAALLIGVVVSFVWDGLGAPEGFRFVGIAVGVVLFLLVEEVVVRRLRKR